MATSYNYNYETPNYYLQELLNTVPVGSLQAESVRGVRTSDYTRDEWDLYNNYVGTTYTSNNAWSTWTIADEWAAPPHPQRSDKPVELPKKRLSFEDYLRSKAKPTKPTLDPA